jgi:hypothetical protein
MRICARFDLNAANFVELAGLMGRLTTPTRSDGEP